MTLFKTCPAAQICKLLKNLEQCAWASNAARDCDLKTNLCRPECHSGLGEQYNDLKCKACNVVYPYDPLPDFTLRWCGMEPPGNVDCNKTVLNIFIL